MSIWEEDDTFLGRWANNELTYEERAEFEVSPEGKEFLDLLIASKGLKIPPYDAKAHFEKVKSSLNQSKQGKVRSLQPVWTVAVAAAVALIITFYFLLSGTSVSTGIGEQKIVWLPDSSKVTLHANSNLAYDQSGWENQRKLELDGEAFFEVKKGSRFEVQTENGVIAVLGTSFNVKSRSSRLEVTCYTGLVNVKTISVDQNIRAGEFLSIEENAVIDDGTHTLSVPSWQKGISTLKDVTLKEALDELQRVYKIKVVAKEVPDLKYTGSFPHDDVEVALKLVLEPLDIEYTYDSNLQVLTLDD